MGEIEVEPVADLETVRNLVDKLELNNGPPKDQAGNAMPKLSAEWCFVDCTRTKILFLKNLPVRSFVRRTCYSPPPPTPSNPNLPKSPGGEVFSMFDET